MPRQAVVLSFTGTIFLIVSGLAIIAVFYYLAGTVLFIGAVIVFFLIIGIILLNSAHKSRVTIGSIMILVFCLISFILGIYTINALNLLYSFSSTSYSDYLFNYFIQGTFYAGTFFLFIGGISGLVWRPHLPYVKLELIEPADKAALFPPMRFVVRVLSDGSPVGLTPVTLYVGGEAFSLVTDPNGYAVLNGWNPRWKGIVTFEWWAEAVGKGFKAESERRRLTYHPIMRAKPQPEEEEEIMKTLDRMIERAKRFIKELEQETY
jgi:hypothetical protein